MALIPMEHERTMGAWGTAQNVPFTAPSDGFVSLYLNPSTMSGGFGNFSVGGVSAYLNSPTGNGATTCVPIRKGESVTQSALSNASIRVYFRPYEWS